MDLLLLVAAMLMIAAVAIATTMFLSSRRRSDESRLAVEAESRLMTRLDSVLDSVSRWREEARVSVQEKIGELFSQVEAQNRDARTELQTTLEQYRKTLDSNREILNLELQQNRKESRESLESVTRSLVERFESLQKSNEQKLSEIRGEVETKLEQTRASVEAQNRDTRTELQTTLEQYRKTLDSNREILNLELQQNRKESRESLESVTRSLVERFESLQKSNEQKLSEIRGEVETKLEQTRASMGNTFKEMQDRLAQLGETNQRIMQFSQDLHELQSILKAPRLRGEVGEIEMERLLRDCLAPDQFDTQFEIADGNRVDAVIHNPQGLLPIDSKFPLEAWRRLHAPDASEQERNSARKDFLRSARGHIESISAKYLHPPRTLDFAVMYVPVESVYYEIIETPEIAEFARLKRVFPASPMTFWALLQVTVIGFRGLRIAENARHIAGLLSALGADLTRFRDSFEKASKQVGHAKTNLDEAAGHLDRFGSKLETIRGAATEGEQQLTLPGAES